MSASDPIQPQPPSGTRALKRARRAWKHAVRSTSARAGLKLMSWLPLSAGQRLGNWFAPLAVRVPGRARNSMMTNLGLCFPELGAAEKRKLATESLANATASMLELGPLWSWPRERVLSLVREVVGLERIEGAIASRRGVVLLGPHLGSWEIVGLWVSARMPMTSLYRPPKVPGLEDPLRGARARAARTSSRPTPAARALFRTPQRGEVVGVLPDQDPGRTAASSRRSSVSRCARARSPCA